MEALHQEQVAEDHLVLNMGPAPVYGVRLLLELDGETVVKRAPTSAIYTGIEKRWRPKPISVVGAHRSHGFLAPLHSCQ
jgi:NADH:ubiquinone oxidoreductase subunit D